MDPNDTVENQLWNFRAFNPFYATGLSLYPLKTSENQSPVARTDDTWFYLFLLLAIFLDGSLTKAVFWYLLKIVFYLWWRYHPNNLTRRAEGYLENMSSMYCSASKGKLFVKIDDGEELRELGILNI